MSPFAKAMSVFSVETETTVEVVPFTVCLIAFELYVTAETLLLTSAIGMTVEREVVRDDMDPEDTVNLKISASYTVPVVLMSF